jgi:NADP-dependent 3-hydroxy acid dehydrogenase YdfG
MTDNLFKINITASIKLVDGLIELIKKNNADIVIVGSTASFNVSEDHGVYCATKHAVEGFIKALQTELKYENVRVIGFHPGGFNSNLRGGIVKDGYMEPKDLASLLLDILKLPKSMEVSEIIINRKKSKK